MKAEALDSRLRGNDNSGEGGDNIPSSPRRRGPTAARRRNPVPALVAAAALGWLPATTAVASSPDCPKAAEVMPRQLVGLWRAEFSGSAQGATLLLEPHREYAQSLSGEINRDGTRARVAADLEDGEFTLEESADGRRISATWLGEVVESSCGKEIRGRREGGWDGTVDFVLRKLP